MVAKFGLQHRRLIEITNQSGFPGERLTGIDTKEMYPKINNNNISAGMPIVLLIHHYSQPNKSYDALLAQQIKKGNLYNEHFATICDFEAKFGKNRYENWGFFAFKHFPKKTNEIEIDEKRKAVGLLAIGEFENLDSLRSTTAFWKRLY